MAYKDDKDLFFLKYIESKDLNDLVHILTIDIDGKKRRTEELTSNKLYKKYYPEHNKYWSEIAAEIQCFGANTIATFFRGGKGVIYYEIAVDVADHLQAQYKTKDIKVIENAILLELLRGKLCGISKNHLESLIKHFNIGYINTINIHELFEELQSALKEERILSYELALITVKIITNPLVTGFIPITLINNIIFGKISFDIMGPAYRVIIPAVAQVAVLRMKYDKEQQYRAKLREDLKKELNL